MVFRVININIRIRNLLGYIHGTVFVFSGLVRLRNKMEAYHNVDACCNDRNGLFCSIFNLRDGHDISYFDALAVVKSMTGLPYRHLQGSESANIYQGSKPSNTVSRIAPFKKIREAQLHRGCSVTWLTTRMFLRAFNQTLKLKSALNMELTKILYCITD